MIRLTNTRRFAGYVGGVSGLVCLALVPLAPVAAAGSDARAADVIARARTAIGTVASLQLKTLAVTAQVQTRAKEGGQLRATEVSIQCALPDKYLRTDKIDFGAVRTAGTVGVNADRLLLDRAAYAILDRFKGKFGAKNFDESAMRREVERDFSRWLFSWFLMPRGDAAFTYTFAGAAEAPDGKANVIDVAGPNGFAVRMFFDVRSHRLLMTVHTRKDESPLAAGASMTVETRFMDPRPVNGVTLPHRMTVDWVGRPHHEDWTIASYSFNPSFPAALFQPFEPPQPPRK